MTADRPVLGILLMLAFCVLAPVTDGLAKILGQRIPVLELVAIRFGFQTIIMVPIAGLIQDTLRLDRRSALLIFLRTCLHILGIALMFTSLLYLPLAEAVAIAFVMPFIMLTLGWAVLNEVIGWRRILASTIGFLGTLLVVQPTFAAVGWPALLPLGVALIFALFMLVTRLLAKNVGPIAIQGTSGLMALPLLALAYWLLPSGEMTGIVIPTGADLWLCALLGVFGSLAHLMMTWSLRYAPSATLAPMQYLEIPVATIVGLIFFGDFPNHLALIGIAITIAAGLYILAREQAVSRSDPAQ